MDILSSNAFTPRKNQPQRVLQSQTPSANNQSFDITTASPCPSKTNNFSFNTPGSSVKSDRFIPNRAAVNYDYCNRMLGEQDENAKATKSKTPSQVKYNSELLGISDSIPGYVSPYSHNW